MSKRRSSQPEPKAPLLQRIQRRWFLIAGIAAVLGWLLLNSNSALSNLRSLPSEVQKTTDQFSGWYYDDAGWSGYWTSNPEGYVNQEDMILSQTPVGIYLQVNGGRIDGVISNQQVCESVPIFDFLLLRGQVDTFGNSATVIVWDTIGGHTQDFAKLRLRRDGVIMTIEPEEDAVRLFSSARIAFDPNTQEWPAKFCESGNRAQLR